MSDIEKLVNKLEWAITGIATFGNEFWDRPQIPRSRVWEETRATLLSAFDTLEKERNELMADNKKLRADYDMLGKLYKCEIEKTLLPPEF
jgi:hypothetical protein